MNSLINVSSTDDLLHEDVGADFDVVPDKYKSLRDSQQIHNQNKRS